MKNIIMKKAKEIAEGKLIVLANDDAQQLIDLLDDYLEMADPYPHDPDDPNFITLSEWEAQYELVKNIKRQISWGE